MSDKFLELKSRVKISKELIHSWRLKKSKFPSEGTKIIITKIVCEIFHFSWCNYSDCVWLSWMVRDVKDNKNLNFMTFYVRIILVLMHYCLCDLILIVRIVYNGINFRIFIMTERFYWGLSENLLGSFIYYSTENNCQYLNPWILDSKAMIHISIYIHKTITEMHCTPYKATMHSTKKKWK